MQSHNIWAWGLAGLLGAGKAVVGQSDYNFSPPSRQVLPRVVFASHGDVTILSAQSGSLDANTSFQLTGPNASFTLDFGLMVAGILQFNNLEYNCHDCVSAASPLLSALPTTSAGNAFGLAFTESSTFVGVASDNSTLYSHLDGIVYIPIRSAAIPAEFNRGSFRYLTVTLSPAFKQGDVVTFQSPSLHFTAAPDQADDQLRVYSGNFSCSDTSLEQIWYAGAYTAQLCTIGANTSVNHLYAVQTVGWANNATATPFGDDDVLLIDGAKRDRNPWSGDVSISLRTALVSQNHNNLIGIRNTLTACMVLQDPETGLFPWAGSPIGNLWQLLKEAYVSDTYHLWTICGVAEYVLASGDIAYGYQYWPQILRGIEATYVYVDNSTGLFNGTLTSDWGRQGMGGQNIELNSIYYHAFELLSSLAPLILGNTNQSNSVDTYIADWSARAARIKSSANAMLFDAATGLYFDNTTDAGHQVHPTDGNCFAVEFNLTSSPQQAELIAGALSERLTQYGATLPEAPGTISPFISGHLINAQFKARQNDSSNAMQLLRTQWTYMLQTFSNSTTIEGYATDGTLNYPFYPDGSAFISHAHAWSSGPTYSLLSSIVGLRSVPGLDVLDNEGDWAFQPHVNGSGVMWASGAFMTFRGSYSAAWVLSQDNFTANLTVPDNSTGTVYVPAFMSSTTLAPQNSTGHLSVDGVQDLSVIAIDGYYRVDGVVGGSHSISLTFTTSNTTSGPTLPENSASSPRLNSGCLRRLGWVLASTLGMLLI